MAPTTRDETVLADSEPDARWNGALSTGSETSLQLDFGDSRLEVCGIGGLREVALSGT